MTMHMCPRTMNHKTRIKFIKFGVKAGVQSAYMTLKNTGYYITPSTPVVCLPPVAIYHNSIQLHPQRSSGRTGYLMQQDTTRDGTTLKANQQHKRPPYATERTRHHNTHHLQQNPEKLQPEDRHSHEHTSKKHHQRENLHHQTCNHRT